MILARRFIRHRLCHWPLPEAILASNFLCLRQFMTLETFFEKFLDQVSFVCLSLLLDSSQFLLVVFIPLIINFLFFIFKIIQSLSELFLLCFDFPNSRIKYLVLLLLL